MHNKYAHKAEVASNGMLSSFSKAVVKDYKMNKTLVFMAIPVFLYYVVFYYLPMYGVLISFQDFNVARGFFHSTWIGFSNYIDFFKSYYFVRLVRNTVLLSVYHLIFGFPAPIILALLLNEIRNQSYKRIVQTVTYMPHFISLVVICGMIVEFTNQDGIINDIIAMLGGSRSSLLLNSSLFRTIYISSGIWQNIGWNSIIYISALSQVDTQLYESAVIDGAGRWRQFLNVTLPQLTPTIIIMFILNIGRLMNESADKVILLYNPSTYETADIISSYVYRRGIVQADYSFAAAVGLLNNLINCALLLFTNSMSRKYSETSLW